MNTGQGPEGNVPWAGSGEASETGLRERIRDSDGSQAWVFWLFTLFGSVRYE